MLYPGGVATALDRGFLDRAVLLYRVLFDCFKSIFPGFLCFIEQQAGLSNRQLAREYGVSHAAVRRALKRV